MFGLGVICTSWRSKYIRERPWSWVSWRASYCRYKNSGASCTKRVLCPFARCSRIHVRGTQQYKLITGEMCRLKHMLLRGNFIGRQTGQSRQLWRTTVYPLSVDIWRVENATLVVRWWWLYNWSTRGELYTSQEYFQLSMMQVNARGSGNS